MHSSQSKATDQLFVGREAELRRFREEVLLPDEGQAVLVIGQQGMGKTMLTERMADIASNHPGLKIACLRYEVTKNDTVEMTIDLMMDHAFEAARGFLNAGADSPTGQAQWRGLIETLMKLGLGLRGEALADLVGLLRREPARHARDQFITALGELSRRLAPGGRAVFVIDPEKYMAPDCDQDWALIIRRLPERIKLVFAQRPDDALASGDSLNGIPNVIRIPESDLQELAGDKVEELIGFYSERIDASLDEIRKAIGRYGGHPYAVSAALDLLADGSPIEDLPADPTPTKIAEAQWKRLCGEYGKDAIRLFEAYAVLEVDAPDGVVEAVAEIPREARISLLAKPFPGGLVRREESGGRIYHSLLSDHIRTKLEESVKKSYHGRAAAAYRKLLADERPQPLAAERLPRHVPRRRGIQRLSRRS